MSVLTKSDILARVKAGSLSFTPHLDTFQVRAHAVDLRLGYTFLVPKSTRLTAKGREAIRLVDPLKDTKREDLFEVIELEEGQYFELLPDEHVSVSSLESIKLPADVMAVLYPRSSISRRGLAVDLTGIIDAGYEGQLMIPIKNHTISQVIRIYPGERFCQVVFESLNDSVQTIQSRYHKRDIAEGAMKDKTVESKLIEKGSIRLLKQKHAQKI
jgi:deoxycytidine triphosphate deaminase